ERLHPDDQRPRHRALRRGAGRHAGGGALGPGALAATACTDPRLHAVAEVPVAYGAVIGALRFTRGERESAGPSGAEALDRGATRAELVLDPVESAIEVVDAVDDGLALGDEAGNHQRHRGA